MCEQKEDYRFCFDCFYFIFICLVFVDYSIWLEYLYNVFYKILCRDLGIGEIKQQEAMLACQMIS